MIPEHLPEQLFDLAGLLAGQLDAMASHVDGLDARTAFFVGVVAWFLVEQAIRRMASVLRMAVLATVLAGGGLFVTLLLSQTPAHAVFQAR